MFTFYNFYIIFGIKYSHVNCRCGSVPPYGREDPQWGFLTQTKLYYLTHFLWKDIFQNIVNVDRNLRYWLNIDQSSVALEIEFLPWVVLSMRPCTPSLGREGSPRRPDKWCLTGSPLLGLRRGHAAAENDVSLSLNHQLFIHRRNCEDTYVWSSASSPDQHKKSLSHFLLQRQSVMSQFKWESR